MFIFRSHGVLVCPKMGRNFIPKREIKMNMLLKGCAKYMDGLAELVRYF